MTGTRMFVLTSLAKYTFVRSQRRKRTPVKQKLPLESFLAFISCSIMGDERVNPLRSNGDKREISLCNIKAFSVRGGVRIKNTINQREFCWQINQLSLSLLEVICGG